MVLSPLVDLGLLVADRCRHEVELLTRLGSVDSTDALPDLECL